MGDCVGTDVRTCRDYARRGQLASGNGFDFRGEEGLEDGDLCGSKAPTSSFAFKARVRRVFSNSSA